MIGGQIVRGQADVADWFFLIGAVLAAVAAAFHATVRAFGAALGWLAVALVAVGWLML